MFEKFSVFKSSDAIDDYVKSIEDAEDKLVKITENKKDNMDKLADF